jgi:hypothetical protein
MTTETAALLRKARAKIGLTCLYVWLGFCAADYSYQVIIHHDWVKATVEAWDDTTATLILWWFCRRALVVLETQS